MNSLLNKSRYYNTDYEGSRYVNGFFNKHRLLIFFYKHIYYILYSYYNSI